MVFEESRLLFPIYLRMFIHLHLKGFEIDVVKNRLIRRIKFQVYRNVKKMSIYYV